MTDGPIDIEKEMYDFVSGLDVATSAELNLKMDFNKVCICGMGGSAIGGDIISDSLRMLWNIPVFLIRTPRLPNWIDEDTLVITSSFSGNTKETLMMYYHARAKGCKIIVISAGGELMRTCLEDGNILIRLTVPMQPRSSIGYTIGYIASIFESLNGPKLRSEIRGMLKSLADYRDELCEPIPGNQALEIAKRLYRKIPIIYSSGLLRATAVRWKNQLNENSKLISFEGTWSEFTHNDVIGWIDATNAKCHPIMLCEEEYMNSSHCPTSGFGALLSRSNVNMDVIPIKGSTILERSLRSVMLGDYVSLYLSLINDVDPGDIESINVFKDKLDEEFHKKGLNIKG